jgi:hypothetical protein
MLLNKLFLARNISALGFFYLVQKRKIPGNPKIPEVYFLLPDLSHEAAAVAQLHAALAGPEEAAGAGTRLILFPLSAGIS